MMLTQLTNHHLSTYVLNFEMPSFHNSDPTVLVSVTIFSFIHCVLRSLCFRTAQSICGVLGCSWLSMVHTVLVFGEVEITE